MLIGQVRVVYTLFILLFILSNITQALVGVAMCHDFKKTHPPLQIGMVNELSVKIVKSDIEKSF